VILLQNWEIILKFYFSLKVRNKKILSGFSSNTQELGSKNFFYWLENKKFLSLLRQEDCTIIKDIKNISKDYIVFELNNIIDIINNKIIIKIEKDTLYHSFVQDSLNQSIAPAPLITDNKKITLNLEDGVYTGDTKNGVPDGRGKLIYSGIYSGDIYEGDFKNGEPEGKGIYYHKDGRIYDGDLKCDKAEGKGILYFKNGDRYEGGFRQDRRHGQGVRYFANGDRIMGDFYNGKEVGIHVLLQANGNVVTKKFT